MVLLDRMNSCICIPEKLDFSKSIFRAKLTIDLDTKDTELANFQSLNRMTMEILTKNIMRGVFMEWSVGLPANAS